MSDHAFVFGENDPRSQGEDADQRAELLRRLYRMSDLALGRAIIDLARASRKVYSDRFGPPGRKLRRRHDAGTILLWHVAPEIGARLIRRSRAIRLGEVGKFTADAVRNGSIGSADIGEDPLHPDEKHALIQGMALDGPNGLRSWADHLLADPSLQEPALQTAARRLIPDPLLVITNEPCNGNPIAMALIRLGPPPPLPMQGNAVSRGWCADNVFEVSRLRAQAGGNFEPGYDWRPEFQLYDRQAAIRLAAQQSAETTDTPAPGG